MMVSSEGQERKERRGGGDNGERNKLAKGAREEERLGGEIRGKKVKERTRDGTGK